MECYEFNWFVGDEVDACAFNMNREVISVFARMVFDDELACSIKIFDKCCRPILGFVVIELRVVTKHFSKIKYSDHASICTEMANGFFGDILCDGFFDMAIVVGKTCFFSSRHSLIFKMYYEALSIRD